MELKKLCAAGVAAALLTASGPALAQQASSSSEDTYRYLELFTDAFDKVKQGYVEEVSDEKLIEYAINGMLTSLDPHSSFMNAKTFEEMQVNTRGEFGGLGIQVTMENGWVKVISPIDDTPAQKAGIAPGDFITHIDGEEVLGLTLDEAVEKMRGPVGSKIVITVRRAGKDAFDVTLVRDVIRIDSVRSRLEGDVGYIRITSFNENSEQGLKKAFADIAAELKQGDTPSEVKGYVLDLRNNPGGLLDQAIAVSDAFLDHGEIVSTRPRNKEEIKRYHAVKGDLADGKPVVVLINDGSASASEIVAGALQDHKRAIILGTKSFGKGSVQTIIPLPGRVALRMTTARYYTPSGRSIQAVGIEPDITVVQSKIEPLTNGNHRRSEASLRNALTNDAKPDGADGEGMTDGETEKAADYQLERAVDLIHGLAIYGQAAR